MAEANFIAPSRTPGWIRLLTHGLFVGAFKRGANERTMLELGSLKDPSTGHQLRLEVWDRSNPSEPLPLPPVSHNSVVSLEVSNPNGIYTYQQAGEFNGDEDDDRYDFRWVADFENDFYPGKKCGKRELGLRFQVNEGLAFTLIRSIPLLRSQDGGTPDSWRRIAQVIAVDIEYKNGRTAELKIDGHSTPLSELNQYNVVLRNDCGGECSDSETSDFNELFRTVIKPNGSPDFAVHKLPHVEERIARILMNAEVRGLGGMFGPLDRLLVGLPNIFDLGTLDGGDSVIDPCGEGFFGKSNGLDDQPNIPMA